MGVKHKFTSGIADGGDTTLVQPSDWNADHQLVASSTDHAIPRFDGTGGDALLNSGVTIDDSDVLTVPDKITVDGIEIWRGAGGDAQSVAAGINALSSVTTGTRNTVIGSDAGSALTEGNSNNLIGRLAGAALTTGSGNTCIGYNAGANMTTGTNNFALGSQALNQTTTQGNVVGIGLSALYSCAGSSNIGIGTSAGFNISTGVYNTVFGQSAMGALTSGRNNFAFGAFAARDSVAEGTNGVTTNNRCIYIGFAAKSGANGSTNEIVIGNSTSNVGIAGKGSNTTVIGNDSATEFWAYGDHHLDTYDIVTDTTTGTKIGTATSQKLGFWNATPIAQPDTTHAESAFTENAGGTAVNDDSTFDGYTLRQVVKALRDAGILA